MYKLRVWIWTLGLLSVLAYIHAVLWELFNPQRLAIGRALHILLPGFQWLTPIGFFIGLGESFLWGAYVALLFVVIHNYFYGIHHPAEKQKKAEGRAA
jgi:hypothetical protein